MHVVYHSIIHVCNGEEKQNPVIMKYPYVCSNAIIQVCKYAIMQVCRNTNIHVCMYATLKKPCF